MHEFYTIVQLLPVTEFSRSSDFQAHRQRSQRICAYSLAALQCVEVLLDLSPTLLSAPRLVAHALGCSQISHQRPQVLLGAPGGHCKGPINSEIANCRIMLRLLSDTLRVSRRLNYILLINGKSLSSRTTDYINLNGSLLVYGMLQRYINSLWTICGIFMLGDSSRLH